MARKKRRNYTAEEKVALIKQHLLERVPVSDICEQQQLNPTVFYRWLKTFFENGTAAFQSSSKPDPLTRNLQRKVEKLETRLKEKNEVIAEVTEEFVSLKKERGGL